MKLTVTLMLTGLFMVAPLEALTVMHKVSRYP